MNGKIQKELLRLGLNGSGNRFYGALFGYETNVSLTNLVLVNVSMYRTPAQQEAIQSELTQNRPKFVNWQWDAYGITLSISGWTGGTIAKNLEAQLTSFCEIFARNGALGAGYCPVCGKELDFQNSKKCQINGNTITLDNDCVDKINEIITAENKEFEAAPNNYLRGFLGALIGGVAGAVVAVLLYLVGFISAISAFVAFFVGILLYKKFGGKPNKMMLVIVTATTFVCMILAVLGIYIGAAGAAAAENGVEMSAFEAFKYVMQDKEVSASFWSDMVMTIIFTIVGCVFEIINHSRKIKRQKNI